MAATKEDCTDHENVELLSSPSSSHTTKAAATTTTTTTAKFTTMNDSQKILFITYLNIVLYALCYQLQRPVEPFLIKSLTEKNSNDNNNSSSSSSSSISQTYGTLQSFFNTAQMIGSPLVGILLDRIGIRYTSAIVFLASALSYGILAVAYDLHTLFWSKVPTMLQAAFLVAQATAATSTGGDTAARAAALGRMTTAYTIGATLGPALGGFLADRGDFYIGAKLAVLGSLVSVVLSLLFLPNVTKSSATSKTTSTGTNTSTTSTTTTDASNATNSNNNVVALAEQSTTTKMKRSFIDELRHSGTLAIRSNLWPLLMVKVLGGVTASMHSTALPLVLTQQQEEGGIGFDPSQLGMSMSGSMFAVAAFGAVGMAPLTKALGAPGMMNSGLLCRAILGCVMAAIVVSATSSNQMADNNNNNDALLIRIVSISILHALASHVLATGLTTQTTGSVDKQEQGALLGLEHSLFSLARIGGPTLGTTLLGIGGSSGGGLWIVEMACGALDVLLVVSLTAALSRHTKTKST